MKLMKTTGLILVVLLIPSTLLCAFVHNIDLTILQFFTIIWMIEAIKGLK
jgi:hypothetical protein